MNNLVPENTSGGTRRKTVAVIVMAVVIAALTVAMAVFLCIGLTHRHTMTAFAAKDATCTEAGNAQYWYCAGCDTCFADEKGSKAISFSDVQIAAHGHSWQAATCTSPRRCSVCRVADGEILGHEFATYAYDDNATCTKDGTETAVCVRCDATHTRIKKDSATGHKFLESVIEKEATCTRPGTVLLECDECGETEKAALPATGVHSWGEGHIYLPQDCQGSLVARYTCDDCGKAYEVTVSLSGDHDWQLDAGTVLKPATCVSDGKISFSCALCQKSFTVTIPATGEHAWGAATVTSPGCATTGSVEYSCLNCDEKLTAVIPATGVHDWDTESGEVTPATETKPGSIVYSCRDCDESFTVTIPATGEHAWGAATVTSPGCATTGSVEYSCLNCDEKLTAVIPATGVHDWDTESGEVTPATETKPGSIVYSCRDCDESFTVTIPATGEHAWGAATVTSPGCVTAGSVEYSCLNCDEKLTAVIPATGHAWTDATCTTPQTCAVCGITQGKAKGHEWGEWQAFSDIHLRECAVCSAAEKGEHAFLEGSCSVCGEKEPAGDAHNGYTVNGITVSVSNSDRTVVNLGDGCLYTDAIMTSVGPGASAALTVEFSGVAERDSSLSLSFSGLFGGSAVDVYAALKNEQGDVGIEYHPVRFHLSIYKDGQAVPVKFCSGCVNCSGHTHDTVAEALGCSSCNNCYLRTMSELEEYFAASDAFTRTYRTGEEVNLRLEIGWLWTEIIEAPYSFEIRGEDGERYYFADGDDFSKWYISYMDTAIGSGKPDGSGTGTQNVYDSKGNHWIIQNDICSAIECYLRVSIKSAP